MSFWRENVIQPALNYEEEAAFREQQEILKQNPSDPKPYFALGTMAHLRGRTGEAIQYFLKSIELDPHSAASHIGLGRIMAIRGQSDLAWKHALEAARLGDNSLVQQLERYPAAAPPTHD